MGRPKGRWAGLPEHMTARQGARGRTLYYYQVAGKKLPLGDNLPAATRKYELLEAGAAKSATRFDHLADAYEDHLEAQYTAKLLALTSLNHYKMALRNLRPAFKGAHLEQIEPRHIKQYMRRRTKKGSAILERKVGNAMWNWGREEGLTSLPNPFTGIKFSRAEKKGMAKMGRRDRYVTHAEFAEVHGRADPILQDAMDLAYRTGQRPSDLLKMTRQDIKEGVLLIVQDKTGAKVPIKIEGKLKTVLERALARPKRIQSMYVIADEHGQRLTLSRLYRRFLKAKGDADWQFRDIRAKTSTDFPDIRHAQRLLGHAKETTTTIYRRSTGEPIAPQDADLERF